MAGLIFILPIFAFDLWLACTTGRRQIALWLERKQAPRIAGVFLIGLILAVWLTVFVKYSMGPELKVRGFPVPLVFFHLENRSWTETTLPSGLPYIGVVTNFLTGLAAPFIPYKVAEFLKKVKAELK